MKKELFLAILIGVVLGFTTTGLFWAKKEGKLNLAFLKKEQSAQEEKEEEPIFPSEENMKEKTSITLEIEEPENEIISQEKNLVIKGKSVPDATIIIIWEEGEDILIADEEGKFETEIELIGGENEIEISAYDDQGNTASEVLIITYSTAEI